MRTETLQLLVVPLILLTACGEETATSPQIAPLDPSFAQTTGDGTANYDAMVLYDGPGFATAISDHGIAVGMVALEGENNYKALRWVVNSTGFTGAEEVGTLPPPYEVVQWQYPVDINSDGAIVGSFRHDGSDHAFFYSPLVPIQPLHEFQETNDSRATGINTHGIIVGSISYTERDEAGNGIERQGAAVWVNTQDEPKLLPPLEGHDATSASRINTDGLVTGSSGAVGGPWVGVYWRVSDTGEHVDGPHELKAGVTPGAVNNQGDIIGRQLLEDGRSRPAFIRGEILTLLDPFDPDDSHTRAAGISNAAPDGVVKIVGAGGGRALLWTVAADGQISGPLDLGVPSRHSKGAYTNAINVEGWIVGASGTRLDGDVPTLWLPESPGGDGDCNPHPKTGKCR